MTRSGTWVLALLVASTAGAVAQESLRVTFKGDSLSPEARRVIADVLAPGSSFATLAQVPIEHDRVIPAEALFPDEWERMTINRSIFAGMPTQPDRSVGVYLANRDAADYLMIDRNSALGQSLGLGPSQDMNFFGELGGPAFPAGGGTLAAGVTIPDVDQSNMLAVPIAPDFAATLSTSALLPGSDTLSSVVIDMTEAESVLSRLEHELQTFGNTTLRIPVDSLNAEHIAALRGTLDETAAEIDEAIYTRPDVEQDLPAGVQLLSAPGDQCAASADEWPMPVDQVEEILKFNQSVRDKVGLFGEARARILIVDSGLPLELAESSDFRSFLKPDLGLALQRGYYWNRRTTAQGAWICASHPIGGTGLSSFGVRVRAGDHDCSAMAPFGQLEPPDPQPVPNGYLADHGGLVGVLAAGGPNLIARQLELHQNIGIGFARVMDTEQGLLQSSDADVAKALDYARARGYDVVNISLAFRTGSADNASRAILCYVDPGMDGCGGSSRRLVVAAAGNVAAGIETSPDSFPASVAAGARFRETQRILIVGGIERDSAGANHPWINSAFHEDRVDLLAPSAGVLSLNGQAERTCMNGTSAAAPQVSFVAGMLFSLGYQDGRWVRERILSTATYPPASSEFYVRAKFGRILNVARALDVYSDLISVRQADGSERFLRGRLVPENDKYKGVMLRLCGPKGVGGDNKAVLVDSDQFALWRSLDPETHIADFVPVNSKLSPGQCTYEPDNLIYFIEHGEKKQTGYRLGDLARIVPSPFRRVLEEFAKS